MNYRPSNLGQEDRQVDLSLDEFARSPERSASLSASEVYGLMIKCSALQGLLLARLLALQATPWQVPSSNDLLTVPEAARRLHFRPAYVYELVRKGSLEAVHAGKYVRISEAALAAWKEGHVEGRI
jgi:DNA binding domain, excisionase family